MEFLLAPMEGVTYAQFRRLHHAFFPGIDAYYTPFLAPSPTGDFKPKFLRELTEDASSSSRVIPQILANSPNAFLITARTLAEIGFSEINLNVGCPSGTVVSKHKGSGMLADLPALDAFLDTVFSQTTQKISIKTRMGLNSTDEFPQILEIYRQYPLSRLIVHARDRKGMYKSIPDLEGVALAFSSCPFPVSYNGDIFSASALKKLTDAIPQVKSVMLGRGIIENPALARTLNGGEPLQIEEMVRFHDSLLESYLESGLTPNYTAERMKGMWYYFRYLFPESHKERKQLLKGKTLEEYRANAAHIFSSCRFAPSEPFIQE